MKTIIYNSKLAKLILFSGYHTIMLLGFILTKRPWLSLDIETHEQIHQRQFCECMALAFLPSFLLSVFFSWWWMLLIPIFYYLLYLGEWLVSFAYHLVVDWDKGLAEINHKAYKSISFEREAKMNQGCKCYLNERKRFAWVKYYGTI